MRVLTIPVLLLAAAAAAGEGGSSTPPAPPPAPSPRPAGDSGKDRDKDFSYYLERARELAGQANASRDPRFAQEAFDSFLSAARMRPKDPVPLAEAGLLALETGDGPSSIRMLGAVYAVAPESAAFHYLRGCLLQGRTEYLDAKAEFAAAKGGDFRPAQAEVRFFECSVGLGLQLCETNRYDAAVKELDEAIAMRPNDPLVPIAYFNLAVSHRRLQSPKEAERVLRLSMERFPSYAPTYGELGDLLTELDRFDEAVDVLDRAVKVDPTYSRGWLLKASTQTTRGKFKEAGEVFEEYEKRFRPTGLSEFYRGVFHQKRGEPEKAIQHLQLALALDQKMLRAIYYIALCHRDLGNEKEAEDYMNKWKKVDEEVKRQARGKPLLGDEKPGGPPPSGDSDRKQDGDRKRDGDRKQDSDKERDGDTKDEGGN